MNGDAFVTFLQRLEELAWVRADGKAPRPGRKLQKSIPAGLTYLAMGSRETHNAFPLSERDI